MLHSALDSLAWWILFAILVAVFLIAFDAAYRFGKRRRSRPDEPKNEHANLVLASLLALVGILLAFSFNIADARYQKRRELVLEEANAIQTTYLRADLLPERHAREIRRLLRRYVDIRLDVRNVEDLQPAMASSEALHEALWAEAMAGADEDRESKTIPLLIASLNEVLDLHEKRLAYGTYYRLPAPMLLSLFVVSLLSMAVLGMVAGLAGTRSFGATLAIVLAVVAVLTLVVELDRPWTRLFTVSQSAMLDVQRAIADGP